ncbi:MAG TPA: hypothetical protein VMV94_10980, partial [Phycisphaerae bacterium]|nr:hypothetical protein [Phycisphaerae bacterium]
MMKAQHALGAVIVATLLPSAIPGYAKEAVYVPAAAGAVSVIDVATNAVEAIVQTNRADFIGLDAFAMAPDTTHAWVVDWYGTLARLDLQTTELSNQISIEAPGTVTQMVISPDATFAYLLTDAPEVVVVDLGAHQVVRTLSFNGASGLALSPDGSRLYVASTDIA